MESSKHVMFNFGMVLGMHYYLKRSAKELHFGLLNLLLKVVYDRWHYCVCEKYVGCQKNMGRWATVSSLE